MRRTGYCVTFDLWQTLIFDQAGTDTERTRWRCEGLQKILSEFDIVLTAEQLYEAHEKSAPQLNAAWKRNQYVSTIDQITFILQFATGDRVNLPQSPSVLKKLENAYVDPVFKYAPTLNPEAIATLEGMRERVSKLGLISNTGRTPGSTLRVILEKFGILNCFDETVFSDEAGCRKPDRRIFDLAAKGLDTDSKYVIHIGDNPEADVWGAKQAGMHAILFNYPVSEEFKQQPGSLFALSRADRRIPDSEVKPDARISSLSEALTCVDNLISHSSD